YALDRYQRQILRHGHDRIAFEPGPQRSNDGIDILRIVDFQIDETDLAMVPGEVLHHLERQHDARQFSRPENAGEAPLVIEHRNGAADVQLVLPGMIVIGDNVVRALERSALDEFEAAAHLCKLVEVHSEHVGDAAYGLHDDAG